MNNHTEKPSKLRRIGAAESFCDARLALGHFTISLREMVKETGLSAVAAKRQLSRLRDRVVRISPRQAFFLIVSPEHRNMGAPPANWWLQDYFNWLGRPYYLALQSAASSFGSNPQALQVTQVMTDLPRRAIQVGRVQIQFFVKRAIEQTPTQQLAGEVAPILISTPEATACDLIRYASRIGGIERAAETIRPLLSLLRAPELKRVLDGENRPAIAQRLGFVFEAYGNRPLARVVREWLPDEISVVTLSPTRFKQARLPFSKRWQLFNNSSELKA